MKNLMFLSAVLLLAIFGCSSSTEVRLGDQSLDDVIKAKGIYEELITSYQELRASLRDKNNSLIIQAQDTISEIPHSELTRQIKNNDSLLSSYGKKINYLEEELNIFVVKSAGKDKKRSMNANIRGGSPEEMANLIAVFSYYDGANTAAQDRDSAAIINLSGKRVRADVYLGKTKIGSCLFLSGETMKVIGIVGPGNYSVVYTYIDSGEIFKAGRFVDCISKDKIDQGAYAFVSTISTK